MFTLRLKRRARPPYLFWFTLFTFMTVFWWKGIRVPLNSGLMTIVRARSLLAFGNFPPSLFNQDQQQISCFVHGSKIVNDHNAVAEDIPFIRQKIERNLT